MAEQHGLDLPGSTLSTPFINRYSELASIREYLARPVDTGRQVLWLVGVGGMGKTALARKVTEELRNDFPGGICWVNLGNQPSPTGALLDLLARLGVDTSRVPDGERELAHFYQSILSSRRALIVIDDAERAFDAIEMLLPQGPSSAALVLGRVAGRSAPSDVVIELGGFEREPTLELLQQYTSLNVSEDDGRALLDRVVGLVDGSPLSIILSARVIEQGGSESLFEEDAGETAGSSREAGYERLVDRVLQHLPEADARDIFDLIAVVPTPRFELGLLAAMSDTEPAAFTSALNSLVNANMVVQVGPQLYEVHKEVRRVAERRVAARGLDQAGALARGIRWLSVQTAFQQEAPLSRDYWTADDALEYAPYADAIAAFIRHPGTRPPLTIGLKAPWGAGKTSLMRMIQERLDPRSNRVNWTATTLRLTKEARRIVSPGRIVTDATGVSNRELLQLIGEVGLAANDPRVLDVEPPSRPGSSHSGDWRPTVWFNPWTYQTGEQVWAGLAHEILTQVTDRLSRGDRERFWLALNSRRVDTEVLRRRVHRLVFARLLPWLLCIVIASAVALLLFLAGVVVEPARKVFGAVGLALLSVSGTTVGVGTLVTVRRFLSENASPTFGPLLRTPDPAATSAAVGRTFDQLVPDPQYEARAGFLHLVHADMKRVLGLVATESRPLVVFVDDVDRCSSDTVAQVMEAINLFLSGEFRNCIFILAMEPAVVAAHIQAAYQGLEEHLPTDRLDSESAPLGWRFLEKIVQLPLSLPPTRSGEVLDRFLVSLIGSSGGGSTPSEDSGTPSNVDLTANPADQAPRNVIADRNVESIVDADIAEEFRPELVDEIEAAILRRAPTVETLADVALGVQADLTGDTHLRRETSEATNRVLVGLYSDTEARNAIAAGVPGLRSDNPREIKRFINLYRFYTFIAQQDRLKGLDGASPVEVAKLAVMAIRWPSLLGTMGNILPDGTTVLAHLEKVARTSRVPGDVIWRAALEGVGLIRSASDGWDKNQVAAARLRDFLSEGPEIAKLAERML